MTMLTLIVGLIAVTRFVASLNEARTRLSVLDVLAQSPVAEAEAILRGAR
jgi:flagellar biogenesis protein FliO